ncbi:aminotransferase class I/II-fold pyridoxal phosphate-dependent enzyme [Legionella taurinensis]|uniref:aminotransferase class I/II-fold pyridoxal phosphate-dependent enzyme n=1 Tax=Legionella taurinensis TaxID=70611 RepID=UPI001358FB7F|nr:aminotransferase class I/II-fold pyridoxal phosphate-dependent enzyme [Legionella taurinensis]
MKSIRIHDKEISEESIQHWLRDKIITIRHYDQKKVALDCPFSQFGLDSIHLMSILSELEIMLDRELPDSLFNDYPTIRTLSLFLSRNPLKDKLPQPPNNNAPGLHGLKSPVTEDDSGSPPPIDIFDNTKKMPLMARANLFCPMPPEYGEVRRYLMRPLTSPQDREVTIMDPFTNEKTKMLMFGSNNYLGFANDPYIKNKVIETINQYGTGIGSAPLLSGYTELHAQLEERLAAFKQKETALVFPNGFAANGGMLNALVTPHDLLVFDEYSHASFIEGVKTLRSKSMVFSHNQAASLAEELSLDNGQFQDIYVGVEGVYSMDGDLAPLDEIVNVCHARGAMLIVDDAHGTGILGQHGSGTAELFHVSREVDIHMGTFSKAIAVNGGFVAAQKEIVEFLRFMARSYMFSASPPPPMVASVLAALDLIENEPWRREKLHANIRYLSDKLKQMGLLHADARSAIFPLMIPNDMDRKQARYVFHSRGLFINTSEYPAVPKDKQRFRISLMAQHTQEDINKLCECIEEVWATCRQSDR